MQKKGFEIGVCLGIKGKTLSSDSGKEK